MKTIEDNTYFLVSQIRVSSTVLGYVVRLKSTGSEVVFQFSEQHYGVAIENIAEWENYKRKLIDLAEDFLMIKSLDEEGKISKENKWSVVLSQENKRLMTDSEIKDKFDEWRLLEN